MLLRIQRSWLSICHHPFIHLFRTRLLSSCQILAGNGDSAEPKTDEVPGADPLQWEWLGMRTVNM